MVLREPRRPLVLEQRDDPEPGAGEVRIRVEACAVCRTDLHVVDGELALPRLPIVPGHEIVGVVDRVGADVDAPALGDRVGVPWLGHTCGRCAYCRAAAENLCDAPVFTGHGRDGGFASHALAEAAYCIALPREVDALQLAPLLCAGVIGWRSLGMAGEDVHELGLYGFGAAAHLVAQVARHRGARVHAFTRPGDVRAQQFARELGAVWSGGSDERPPVELDAAILFAPVGELVPAALAAVRKGGRVVCGGIHMSDIPSFAYALLWGERHVRSVANLTRRDAAEFFAFVAERPLRVDAVRYALEDANAALGDLRGGRISGAAVLVP